MAFVFKGPKSKFWVAGFLDLNGKRRNRSTRTTNRREAQKIADEYELATRKHRTSRQVREVISELHQTLTGEDFPTSTFEDFVNAWLERKKPETANSTLTFYRGSTTKFLTFLGERKTCNIDDIASKDILAFRNELAEKLAGKTANHHLKCLRMVFKAANREGLISEDPTEFVDPVKDRNDDKPARRPFKIKELEATLAAADGEWESIIMFGIYTGQRIGDISTLVRSNIDLKKKQLKFITRKTRRKMTIPLSPPLVEYLKDSALPQNANEPIHPKAHILVTENKGSSLSNQFARILTMAGLREKPSHRNTGKGRSAKRDYDPLSFHCLRHTATTLLHEAGVPSSVAQALIGHDSEAVHEIYVSIGDTALQEAASALPRINKAI